jgi:leucyl-tRNA synthetase
MELVNRLYVIKTQEDIFESRDWKWALETLLQLLAPFAPHITEELWAEVGHKESIHLSKWPVYDEKYLKQDTITIAIQVNGKLRSDVKVPADATEDMIVEAAKKEPKASGYLKDQKIRKTIYVPGRLVNFVV